MKHSMHFACVGAALIAAACSTLQAHPIVATPTLSGKQLTALPASTDIH